MNGDVLASIASIVVRYPVCVPSTSMPTRFISLIIARPNRDRPASVRSAHPSPTRFFWL